MELIQSFLLGIIQGLTEFLPVSSSGHLAVFPVIMGSESKLLNSMAFDVFLHGGTLIGVLLFFRKRIVEIISGFFKGIASKSAREDINFKLGIYIIAATIPAVIVALLFKDSIESVFRGPTIIAVNLIAFGIILFIADRKGGNIKGMDNIKFADALIIGCLQAIALMPGVSRSGITITAALFLGYKREDAAEFSFLLSIPAITGAFIFTLPDLAKSGLDNSVLLIIVGFLAAGISGMLAIKFLLAFVKKHSYMPFVIYRVVLGVFILLMMRG